MHLYKLVLLKWVSFFFFQNELDFKKISSMAKMKTQVMEQQHLTELIADSNGKYYCIFSAQEHEIPSVVT